MRFFILVFIPLALTASLAMAGWMIFRVPGALAGGLGGCILLILGIVIFIKDREESGQSDPSPPQPYKSTPISKNISIKPSKSGKVKISKSKKGDKKSFGVLKGAQVLLKNVSRDPATGDVLIDATIVPVTENGAFAPWYPDDMVFAAFASEADALAGARAESYTFSSWKRWIQSDFKIVESDSLRGSCRLQYAVPVPVAAPVKFLIFRYQDECFGAPIALPTQDQIMAENPAVTGSPDAGVAASPEEIAVFVLCNGQQTGPYTLSDLWVEIAEGRVLLTDHAWYEGLEEWILVSQLVEDQTV